MLFPNNLNNDKKMLIGHEIGKINKISKFLNLPPSLTIILKICLIGKMRSNNKFFNF